LKTLKVAEERPQKGEIDGLFFPKSELAIMRGCDASSPYKVTLQILSGYWFCDTFHLPDSNGFKTQFQGIEAKMFLTRCKDVTKKNSLYFTSMLVRDIVTSNVERVKIINTGVKAFCKCENKGADCNFRYRI
jgi:hypothetical protein